jgi:hypothetical protein
VRCWLSRRTTSMRSSALSSTRITGRWASIWVGISDLYAAAARRGGAGARVDPFVQADWAAGGVGDWISRRHVWRGYRGFRQGTEGKCRRLAKQSEYRCNLRRKHERRVDDESAKPLASYRAEELQRMWVNFFGPDPAYHEARRRFVFKGNAPPRPNNSTVEVEVTQTSWVHPQRYLSNSIASQLAVG